MSIASKELVFGGAGIRNAGNPWGMLGEIVGRALEPHGYQLTIQGAAWGVNNPRYVGDGLVDLGATRLGAIRRAYEATGQYKDEAPRKNLRVIACINHAGWVGVATKWESRITDLGQIKEGQIPVSVYCSGYMAVLHHYGLTRELIESWGGKFLIPATAAPPGVPAIRAEWARSGDFDVIIDNIYGSYTPEIRHWHEASIIHNLRFLPLPDDLIEHLAKEHEGVPGFLPHNLYRGVTRNLPTMERGPQAIYARDDTPDDFVYLLAKALDDHREYFRQAHIAYSYDPRNAADAHGLPLHPAAERYYREAGYL